MRLNEQRDTLVKAIEDAGCELIMTRAAIFRKIASPYGDGSKSNMVNAETDVLPRLSSIFDKLAIALDQINGTRCHTFYPEDATTESIRIW